MTIRATSENISIESGSYDPLQNGHVCRLIGLLKSADWAALDLQRVMIIPSGSGGRRDKVIQTDPAVRLQMAHILAESAQPYTSLPVSVSDLDIFRSPNTPTYFLWQELRREWPRARFFIIIGSDWPPEAIRDVWVEGPKLTDPVHGADFIIAPRAGYPLQIDRKIWPNFHVARYHPDFNPPECSSTKIREMVRRNEDIAHLVPPAIAELIAQHKLYQL